MSDQPPLLLGLGQPPLALDSALKTPMLVKVIGSVGDHKERLWAPPTGLLTRCGHNLQFHNLFNNGIDWDKTAADLRYGTGLIRWQSVFWRSESYRDMGWQSMFHGKVTDLKRDAGDASVMTFLCEYNNYVPEGGQPFLLAWANAGDDDSFIEPNLTHAWGGFAIPLKQKLTVDSAAQESGKLRVKIRFPGQTLPETTLATPNLIAYHWNFYRDASKSVRVPLTDARDLFAYWCKDLRQYAMWGGEQGIPTWYSDYQKVKDFGTALVQEIKLQEYEWRANAFADIDPRNLAQAFENERLEGPEDEALAEEWQRDFNYAALRAAMPDATILHGSRGFKAPHELNSLRPLPNDGKNKGLEFHIYPGHDGFDPFVSQQITDLATMIHGYRASLGFDLAVCGEFGVGGIDGYDPPRDNPLRGVPLGKMLTGMQGNSIPLIAWSMVGDGFWSAYPDENGVLSFFPNFKDQCSRVGDTTL